MRDLNAAAEDRLVGIVRSLLQAPITAGEISFEYLPGGYSNENYRFSYQHSDYVLRVPNRPRPFIDRLLESQIYRDAPPGISFPRLVALDADSGNMLTFYEPGDLLADAPPSLAALADYLKSFHAALPESARVYDPFELSRVYLSLCDVTEKFSRLADRTWQPANTGTCHNDLNPWNIIQSAPERWVTLDWEWYGVNDPLFDLVTLHEGLTLAHSSFDERSLNELVGRWAEAPVEESRLEQCLTAFWLREYSWARAERQQGNDREEIQNQIEAAADRLEALST